MKIGILQTGYAPDALRDEGDYPDMFMTLLDGHGFSFASYDLQAMQFPTSVTECDGWLITGSKHGVYEDHGFIPPLEQFIRDAFAARRPVAGICFGHQIMAQALGGTVEKFKGGWSIGPTRYEFDGEPLNIHAWHQDQVITPPEGARTFASNDFCQHAGLVYGDLGYSVQPHPEFSDPFVLGLIDKRGRGVVPDTVLDTAKSKLGAPLHSNRIATDIARFFKSAEAHKHASA